MASLLYGQLTAAANAVPFDPATPLRKSTENSHKEASVYS